MGYSTLNLSKSYNCMRRIRLIPSDKIIAGLIFSHHVNIGFFPFLYSPSIQFIFSALITGQNEITCSQVHLFNKIKPLIKQDEGSRLVYRAPLSIVLISSFFNRGTQRQEYSSKPVQHNIVERILVFKRQIQAYFYSLKIFHLVGFPS